MAKSTPKGKAIISLLLDSSALEKDLKRVEANFKRVGAGITRAGAGLAAFGTGIIGALKVAADAAGDAAEVINRFEAVFGSAAKEVKIFADALGKELGRSSVDILDALSNFQGFFVGLGKGSDEAARLSKQLVKLSLDFASFNNLSDDEAITRFIAGLSGSSEVFDKFGINIKAAALNQKFLQQGLNKTTATATEAEKVAARLAIIAESLGKQGAVGDAAKTANSYNNTLKKLNASIKELLISIGGAVLKDFRDFTAELTSAIRKAAAFIEQNKGLVSSLLKISAGAVALGAALIAVGGSIIATGAIIGSIASIVGTLSATFALLKAAVLATGGAIATAFASPLLGIGIIIGSVITEVLELRALFKGLTADVGQDFANAFTTAKTNFDLFKQAILAGDLKLAFQILTKSIKLFFFQAFDSVIKKFDEVKSLFLIVINEIIGNAKKLGTNIAISFNAIQLAGAKAAEFLVNAFRGPLKTIENIFILLVAEIQKAWVTLQSAVKAGIQFGKGDRKGAIETIQAIEDQKADIEKVAEEKIVANIIAGDTKIKSKAVKELEEEAKLLREVYNDLENEIAKKTEDIFKQPEIEEQKRQQKIDKLKEELEALGLSLNNVTEKAKENAKQTDKGTQNFSKGITSLVPKFGKAVEAGSSAAVQLFGTSSPLLREQQKQSKILSSIAENTQGLTTG